MTTLELISHALCPYVHRAAALLTENGVEFTRRTIDLQAKPDWFLALSPRGKVPVLVTEGTSIFESAVILEYLAETRSPQMIERDPLARAKQRMWAEISNDLMAGQYKISVAKTPTDRDAAFTAARDALQRFEEVVVGPYFGGDAIGLVDFAAGPALVRFERLDRMLGLDSYRGLPRMAAWSNRLAGRPAFRDTLAADFDQRFRALVVDHGTAAA
ncbi:MAG: glutathione S-transferase family protein [Kofleriaceae bacterium]